MNSNLQMTFPDECRGLWETEGREKKKYIIVSGKDISACT